MRKGLALGLVMVMLAAAFLSVSCKKEDELASEDVWSNEMGSVVNFSGGTILCGRTISDTIHIAQVPYTMNYTLQNWSSDVTINYWGIYDTTPYGTANYTDGAYTISYANSTNSFSLTPQQTYPYTVTLANNASKGVTIAAGNTYAVQVSVSNKNGITPNPLFYWIVLSVVP